MSDTLFRAASTEAVPTEVTKTPAVKGQVVPSDKVGAELSPLLYIQENGVPYAASYWDVEDLVNSLDIETVTNMEHVDEYFKKLVEEGKYENDKLGYKEYMRKMEKTADVEHAPLRTKAGKIAEFVKYMLRSRKYGIQR